MLEVREFSLFPTKLLALRFPDVDRLNHDLERLFDGPDLRGGHFDMHPRPANLLRLAEVHPCLDLVRRMFLDGLGRWLKSEGLAGDYDVSVTLFSNIARRGDYTLVHNHSADVVGVYYVRTGHDDAAPDIRPHAEG